MTRSESISCAKTEDFQLLAWRSRMGDGYAEFAHKPFRRETQADLPAKLIGNAIDEAGSETAACRLSNRWPALLGPRQLEPLRFFIGRRCNLDTPVGGG